MLFSFKTFHRIRIILNFLKYINNRRFTFWRRLKYLERETTNLKIFHFNFAHLNNLSKKFITLSVKIIYTISVATKRWTWITKNLYFIFENVFLTQQFFLTFYNHRMYKVVNWWLTDRNGGQVNRFSRYLWRLEILKVKWSKFETH